jgi:hypothetical protein
MALRYSWNTNKPVTVRGQRIGAILRNDDSIIFADIDLDKCGYIPPSFMPEYPVKHRVMRAYLNGEIDCAAPHIDFYQMDLSIAQSEAHLADVRNYHPENVLCTGKI